jgi:hypothetical protein
MACLPSSHPRLYTQRCTGSGDAAALCRHSLTHTCGSAMHLRSASLMHRVALNACRRTCASSSSPGEQQDAVGT